MRYERGLRLAPLLALLAVACAHAPAQPGVLHAERLDAVVVRWQAPDRDVAAQVRRVLPRALEAARRWGALEPVTLTIHPTHAALEEAARRAGYPWLRAWSRSHSIELQSPRSWSRGSAADSALAQLLAHELTHCAMYQAVGAHARSVPLWFREGMAMTAAGEPLAAGRAPGDAPSLARLASRYRSDPAVVYPRSHAAFRALLDHYGAERVRGILRRVGEGEPFAAAFEHETGVALEVFEGGLDALAAREEARG